MKASPPSKGELVWCYKCDTYTHVGPTVSRMGVKFYPDYEWVCKGERTGFVGMCVAHVRPLPIAECRETFGERYDWYALRDKMMRHYLRMHSGSSLISRAEIVPIPRARVLTTDPPF